MIVINFVQSKGRPFKVFTPLLIGAYNKLKEAGENFEIIFVNCDEDEEAWREQLANMPWIALPFKSTCIQQLAQSLDVSGKNHFHIKFIIINFIILMLCLVPCFHASSLRSIMNEWAADDIVTT